MKLLKIMRILMVGVALLFFTSCGGSRKLDPNMDNDAYIRAVLEITNENFAKLMKKQNKKSGKKPASVIFSHEGKRLIYKIKWMEDLTDEEIEDQDYQAAFVSPTAIYATWQQVANADGDVITDVFKEKLCAATEEFFFVSETKDGKTLVEVPITLDFFCKEFPVEKGSLLDTRDGRSYETVQIGSQVWMAENLNYKVEKSDCPDNKDQKCNEYGRLYTWDAMQKACPSDWHVPTEKEWNSLILSVGGWGLVGKVLKSRKGWNSYGNGIDSVGFKAKPAGYMDNKDHFSFEGHMAWFWSSSVQNLSNWKLGISLSYDNEKAQSQSISNQDAALSIRCIKD